MVKVHSESVGLETSLAEAEEQNLQVMELLIMTGLACLTLGRFYLSYWATDPLTGLFNELPIIAKIKK